MTDALPESHLASLPAAYLAAEYKWELSGQWLPLQIGERAEALEDAYPDARHFGVISAANPGQVFRADLENRSADQRLQARLDALGLRYRPAFVAARGRSWKAYNWLVIDPEPAQLDALAEAFGQIGSLSWARGTPVKLRMRARRPASVAEHPHIEWVGGDAPAAAGENPAPSP